GDKNYEGASRSANLKSTAAKRGNEKSADNRSEQALVGREAGSNGNRHRQRQRYDGNGQAGDSVRPEIACAVAITQDGDELWGEQLGERGLGSSQPTLCSRLHISVSLIQGAVRSSAFSRRSQSQVLSLNRGGAPFFAHWCGRGRARDRRTGFEADATARTDARRSLGDELDPCAIEGGDDFGQSVDHPAHGAFTGLHALNRRQRNSRKIGQCLLVDPQQRPPGPHLRRSDHGEPTIM